MRIFHVATEQDWTRARQTGLYRAATYGRTLTPQGYIRAARRAQVSSVLGTRFADVSEPLVLLEIETDLLDVPWREEMADDDLYPHIYGPLSTRAVVAWGPARQSDTTASHSVPPNPVLTTAFRGLAIVLGAATVTFLVAALTAHNQVSQGTLSHVASFAMWSFFWVCGVTTVTSLAVAEYVRSSSVPAPVRTPPGAKV